MSEPSDLTVGQYVWKESTSYDRNHSKLMRSEKFKSKNNIQCEAGTASSTTRENKYLYLKG